MQTPNAVELISAGVDWLTSTTDEPKAARRLWTKATFWLNQEASRGNDVRTWTMSGYKGHASGSVQMGERPDGLIVRLGGHMAHDYWREVFELTQRASRIDTQYTIRFDVDPAVVIKKLHGQCQRWSKRRKAPRSFSCYTSSDGSSTLYLGSRESETFGRIYDKWRESKQESNRNAVRFETEWKGTKAKLVATHLASSENVAASCASLTAGVVQDSGGSSWVSTEAHHTLCVPTLTSDAERRLQWLRSQVRPVVARLLEVGLRDEVLESLSLLPPPGAADKA